MKIESILMSIKKMMPESVYHFIQPMYHFSLALVGAVIYGFPSKKIKVLGITGTKGKSSTTEIVNAILEDAELKTAVAGTIRFKIGSETHPNMFKMTMPGRFFIHKFIRDAVKAKCDWVILEMTSQGVLQSRHKFIDLDALIFTNLAPEHIESHGSYEKYKEAKLQIAKQLNNKKSSRMIIVNADDIESEDFVKSAPNAKPIRFGKKNAEPYTLLPKMSLRFDDATIYPQIEGEFNMYNILGAASFAKAIGVPTSTIKHAVENLKEIPGRAQKINVTTKDPSRGEHNFDVYVDYAHTIESLTALYEAFPKERRKICVLGNTGGGRDTWKRPKMAEVADNYCDHIILTDEDPYDEDPQEIINEMKEGIKNKPFDVILDRRKAISHALQKAENGNVVLITGKGTDPYIMRENGKKESWSDYDVVKEEVEKLKKS